jgi:hypothetical protein
MRPALEVADIFRRHGDAFRNTQRGHLSQTQRRVMTAIEACRTARLGGHAERCEDCGEVRIAYNSCRNRHCPKCQGLARAQWLEKRRCDLVPVQYFHVVFTMPACLAAIALQNKVVVYDILFKAAADAVRIIGADPKYLGAETGMVSILHTWGQTLTHHPHLHCLVPGGGLGPNGRWVACRSNFFLPVHVLSRLYRRRFLEKMQLAFDAGKLGFFGDLVSLRDPTAFAGAIASVHRFDWVVYVKRPFAGAQQVLDYLARYTHRVAIANGRLLSCAQGSVRFRWKDYRSRRQNKVLSLDAGEFIRRFLLHVLPRGFRRIRHFGFLANIGRKAKLAQIRTALGAPAPPLPAAPVDYREHYAAVTGHRLDICPCCGGRMIDIGIWSPAPSTRGPAQRCDTS